MNPAIYENQYIGAFIYVLGYNAALKNQSQNHINLIQQTPQDARLIGDLFASWKGKNFIIEFKRSHSQLIDEKQKRTHKRLLENLNKEELAEISVKTHFIGYGNELKDSDSIDIVFAPYITISENFDQIPREKINMGLNDFVEKILKSRIGSSSSELKKYFEVLKRASTVSSGFTGLIVNISEKGMPNLIKFDSAKVLEQRLDLNLGKSQSQSISRGF